MIVPVAPDVTWLAECFALEGRHKHVSAYLLGPPAEPVLVDTGAPAHGDAILAQLETATDGAGPAAVVLTHGDLPHTGNVGRIRDRWGDVPVYAATAAPEILGFAPSIHCEIGSTRTVAGRRLRFVDPPLADIRATMWIHDQGTGALLTGDGLGHYHAPGHCGTFDAPVTDEAIADYHRSPGSPTPTPGPCARPSTRPPTDTTSSGSSRSTAAPSPPTSSAATSGGVPPGSTA